MLLNLGKRKILKSSFITDSYSKEPGKIIKFTDNYFNILNYISSEKLIIENKYEKKTILPIIYQNYSKFQKYIYEIKIETEINL